MSSYKVIDGSKAGSVIAALTVVAKDGDDAATFTLIDKSSDVPFEIVGSSLVAKSDVIVDSTDFAYWTFVIRAADTEGLSIDKPVTIIAVKNSGPVISSDGGADVANRVVFENEAVVTTVAAADPDVVTTLIYSIIGGADQGKFQINASSGLLTFKASPDFELPQDADQNNSYIVQVQVSDGSLTDKQTLTVSVGNANESPSVTSNGAGDIANVSVAESSTTATIVTATDPDAGTTLTYSIIGGADQTTFQINPSTGALTFATSPDFEFPHDADQNNTYIVQVQVSDGSLTDTQTLTINVTDVLGGFFSGPGNYTGTPEQDLIEGDTSNQTFAGNGGDDVIDGGGGHDTVVFTGPRAGYDITPGISIALVGVSPPLIIEDKIARRDGTDTVSNIDYLEFADKTIVVANVDDANIARLYSAALDRQPDKGGLNGWKDLYAAGIPEWVKWNVYEALAKTPLAINGLSIAGGFTNSMEFQTRYGPLNNTQFVSQLYNNVLDRDPEAAGLNGWLDLMSNGGFTREMVLVGFAQSPENIAKTAADWLIQI